MTVNHSGALSVEYFESYFKLVLSSRAYDFEGAEGFILNNFFKGDPMLYGKYTYNSFITACRKAKNN